MSEYELVHFLALDGILDAEDLAFMRKQSSRAEISNCEFRLENHPGDFHGDPKEMLRCGYDAHLHYATCGVRRLMFRMSDGPLGGRDSIEPFLRENAIQWHADGEGPGGVLEISLPADACRDDVYNPDTLLLQLAPLRHWISTVGDRRPLYLAWLACAKGEELEPPVPAGLDDLPPSLLALAKFSGVPRELIVSAAERSPRLRDAVVTRAFRTALSELSAAELRKVAENSRCRFCGPMSPLGSKAYFREELERFMSHAAGPTLLGDAAGDEPPKRVPRPVADPARTIAQLRTLAKAVRGGPPVRRRAAAPAQWKRLGFLGPDRNPFVDRARWMVRDYLLHSCAETCPHRDEQQAVEAGEFVRKDKGGR